LIQVLVVAAVFVLAVATFGKAFIAKSTARATGQPAEETPAFTLDDEADGIELIDVGILPSPPSLSGVPPPESFPEGLAPGAAPFSLDDDWLQQRPPQSPAAEEPSVNRGGRIQYRLRQQVSRPMSARRSRVELHRTPAPTPGPVPRPLGSVLDDHSFRDSGSTSGGTPNDGTVESFLVSL